MFVSGSALVYFLKKQRTEAAWIYDRLRYVGLTYLCVMRNRITTSFGFIPVSVTRTIRHFYDQIINFQLFYRDSYLHDLTTHQTGYCVVFCEKDLIQYWN